MYSYFVAHPEDSQGSETAEEEIVIIITTCSGKSQDTNVIW